MALLAEQETLLKGSLEGPVIKFKTQSTQPYFLVLSHGFSPNQTAFASGYLLGAKGLVKVADMNETTQLFCS